MTPAERHALAMFTDQIAQSSDRPCACGKSPRGTQQEIVGKPSIKVADGTFSMRCTLECQKCHERHGYVSSVIVSRELLGAAS